MTEQNLAELYASYRGKVLAYLTGRTERPEDAEDLCQEVFAQVARSLPRYDPEKASVSTWIYQITRFTLIDYLRTRHSQEALLEELPANEDLEASILRKETLANLAAALTVLDPVLRDIVVLRYYKGCSLTEIARLTGRGYGMVKVLHKKALEQLRKELSREETKL